MTSSEKMKRSRDGQSGWSLIIPSFVIHGISPGEGAPQAMPRKLDDRGNTVATPGAGIQYESKFGFTLIGAMVKDCYDNLAGTIQIGKMFKIGRQTKLGLTMGVYARETPLTCTTTTRTTFGPSSSSARGSGPNSALSIQTISQPNCTALDGFDWKFVTTVNGESVDLIPLPFAHFSTALIKTRSIEVDFRVMSNFILNEFGISIPF
jgi:hypothetical protein